jgi:hypothetical protein
MQAIICYVPGSTRFVIIDFAKSVQIGNMPVASGPTRYVDKEEFLADAARLIQDSLDGYPSRRYQPSELFQIVSEKERENFFSACRFSLLFTYIVRLSRVNVVDRNTGLRIRELRYPLEQAELCELLNGLLVSGDSEALGHGA